MKRTVLFLTAVLFLGGFVGPGLAESPAPPTLLAQTTPDNTGRNVRDRNGNTLTPGDQSSDRADLALTRRIRKAVVADKSLSITAHNIKIITANGVVTLRGPVKSEKEKAKIAAKAQKLAGTKQVENQLEVAAH